MKKKEHHVMTGTIVVLSGMRIGGSDDILEIGGTDLTCIKDPVTKQPYIPGSSLKGKLRSCLERVNGKCRGDDPCGCARSDCPVCRVFGPHKKNRHDLGPTRIIVRDAHCIEGGDTELKTEATIKRSTGSAQHPRTVERVVPGSKFKLEIAYQVFDLDEKFKYQADENESWKEGGDAILEVILHAIDLVCDTNIGSGQTKGYGQIDVIDLKEEPKKQSRRTKYRQDQQSSQSED